MDQCDITILTTTEGQESRYTFRGRIRRREDGYIVRYRQEETVTLLISKARFSMLRDSLKMNFQENKETVASLGFAHSAGVFKVFTNSYQFRDFAGDRAQISLDYELRFPAAVQAFSLKITIRLITEET